jgi:hypothetical protein
MRRSLSLGLLLVALSALPATAGHGGGAHVAFGSHPHFAGHFNHFNRFGRSRFSSGWGWGWGWGLSDWDNWNGWPAGGAPGMVIVLAGAPPAAYAPPPPPAKATVETEAGVTVFRGPGSHHLR